MRVIESDVGIFRRQVFTEVARLALEDGDLATRIEEIPFKISPGEIALHRESVFLERAVVGERVRLAMGLPLRPADKPVPLSSGLIESNIDEKYYDPPLINIIKFACNACQDRFFITNGCQGCLARPCIEVCPKGAISFGGDRRTHIDQEKCIKCGRCLQVCSYEAIIRQKRPCAEACGVDAIDSDERGRAIINEDKCVECGMCIVNCPFGAISDKGQIFQMCNAMKRGESLMAIVAPAFVGQFGGSVKPKKLRAVLQAAGFDDVFEVAVGADLCAITEAQDFLEHVPKKTPFMATSCCPSWSVMAKHEFPEFAHCVSMALTPMVLTARMVKKKYPNAKIVFIGPCSSKKLEASRKSVRSDVDFVLTFEELMGVFEAKDIDFKAISGDEPLEEATADGRGFAVSGGVAKAVVDTIGRLAPDKQVNVACAEGLRECKKLMQRAAKGEFDGYLLEGMACPGGCIAGTGTRIDSRKASTLVNRYKDQAPLKDAMDSGYKDKLHMLEE